MSYGKGQFMASQRLALLLLADYLRLAEQGNMAGLLDAIDSHTQEPERHPNAVILEAVLLLLSIYKGTGRSMAKYASAVAGNFDNRQTAHIEGLWIPPAR